MKVSSKKSRRLAAAIAVGALGCFLHTLESIYGPAPVDGPSSVHHGSPRPLVVALGDSLTHGVVSHPWLADLASRFKRVKFLNTARCAHTSHAVLGTARSLTLHKPPDLVLILVGTNDAISALSPMSRKFYVDRGHLPADAPTALRGTLAAYERNLGALVTHARRALRAKKVVVISPPPFGNGRSARALPTGSIWGDLVVQPNVAARLVARRAALVARRRGAVYVDLHAALSRQLAREPLREAEYFNASAWQLGRQILRAPLVRFVPGLTFNRLSSTPYLHDHLHLNGRGAQLLVDALAPLVARLAS
ncbi:hypothetical protein KFE25_001772 [Diacronema lutheri]|uniref:SGNH hydrolase-type esterase domain-containing protein n=2 Tax=Diacronema lutheri TaxID=2081491 RepID=A0A8J6C7Q7_DIALT|nr:hypothetical protein KFE25_001772 [Diacronema lutheri]